MKIYGWGKIIPNALRELPKPNVEEIAYYLWENGSQDTLLNWLEAEKIVLGELK